MTTQDNIFPFGDKGYQLIPNLSNKGAIRGLMITLKDGSCHIESYTEIVRRHCDPSGRFLTIHIRGVKPFILIGHNLNKLMVGLQHQYIEHLYCYDEDKHKLKDAENNPPIIEQICEGIPTT